MLVWTCLETQKERKKKKRKKEKGNVTMKYLSLSWQVSIGLAYLPTSSFILSFFLLFSLFPLFFLSFHCFLCFGARIYSLTQWREILYIVDDVKGFHMKLDLKKIETGDNLEASLSVF